MRWLVIAFGALLAVPVLLLGLWAYGELPSWLELWHLMVLLPLTMALFLAAALVELLTIGEDTP